MTSTTTVSVTAHRQRRYRIRAAQGRPTTDQVDAEPARQHIQQLRGQGMGWKRIAEKSGVPRGTIEHFLYGNRRFPPSRRIHRDIARAILATRVDTADAARVCGVGCRRRLRALVAIGWSHQALADRLGMLLRNFARLINNDEGLVNAARDRAVRDLYDELWDRMPPQATPGQRGVSTRARERARRRGWVSPLAWDDDTIDDPDVRPNLRGVAS